MIDLSTVTDKDIFDAIRYRRGGSLPQETVDYLNAVMYPNGKPGGTATYDRAVLETELMRDEGKRLKAYKDTKGLWSIGIGRNLDGVGTTPLARTKQDVIANGITDVECDQLFNYDIGRTEADLDRYATWWRKLDPVRQRVMLNMCFNMGWGAGTSHGLHTFVNTLGMIERGDYSRAADAMLQSKWAREVGDRAKRLADMMKAG
jgi:lysozyme